MLTITIKGMADSGKSTTANIIKEALEASGYRNVTVADLPPSTDRKRQNFEERIARTHAAGVRIEVSLEVPPPAAEPKPEPPAATGPRWRRECPHGTRWEWASSGRYWMVVRKGEGCTCPAPVGGVD